MQSPVTTEMVNLYNSGKLSTVERTKIDTICNNVITDGNFLVEIENTMKSIITSNNFKIEEKIPSLISAILHVTKRIEYYKQVDENRMKYILYCVLISSLLKFHPDILKTIEIEKLRTLYLDAVDLVLLIPESIKVARKSCLSCVGSKVKLFSWLNKDKILI